MRTPHAASNEMMCPAGFIEIRGPSLDEEQQTTIDAYFELMDDVYLT